MQFVKHSWLSLACYVLLISTGLFIYFQQARRDKLKRVRSAASEAARIYKSFYDADGYGTKELTSGRRGLIPWVLTQRIEISPSKSPGMVWLYIMAEFHSDNLEFNLEESKGFLTTAERFLEEFNLNAALAALDRVTNEGADVAIYFSPLYPDDITGKSN